MKPDLPIDTQILWLAAELIEHRYAKGSSEDGYCALRAIGAALYRLRADPSAAESAVRRLAKKANGNVILWNDAPERTAAEVALALRTA